MAIEGGLQTFLTIDGDFNFENNVCAQISLTCGDDTKEVDMMTAFLIRRLVSVEFYGFKK